MDSNPDQREETVKPEVLVVDEEFFPKQSLGDTIDRLSILTRKIYFGEEDAYPEFSYLRDCLNLLGLHGDFTCAVIRLAQMNFEIWNLENELRRDLGDKISDEEAGRRSKKIRDLNKKRVKYKNDINQMVGGFTEFKICHRSQ